MTLYLYPAKLDEETAERRACAPALNLSYLSFGALRRELAKAEGIDLNSMAGYEGNLPWSSVDSGLKDLLDHSDVDGTLTPSQCFAIYPRLEVIVDGWLKDGPPKTLSAGTVTVASEIVEQMKLCSKHGWDLVFA